MARRYGDAAEYQGQHLPTRARGGSALPQRDHWQGLRNTIGNVGNAPTGLQMSPSRRPSKATASDGPFAKLGWIGKMLTAGNPSIGDIEAQQFSGAQAEAAKHIQEQIASGVPPQKAVLDFMQTPQGMEFFSSGGNLQSLANIGQLAGPDPAAQAIADEEAAYQRDQKRKLAEASALSEQRRTLFDQTKADGIMTAEDYESVAAELMQSGDEEGARLALDFRDRQIQDAKDAETRKVSLDQIRAQHGTAAQGLRKEITDRQEYKDYVNVASTYNGMVQASGVGNRQADLSLIIGLAKMRDPTSVVSINEAGLISSTGTYLGDKIQNIINAYNGQGLTSTMRDDIMREATTLANERRGAFDTMLRGYDPVIAAGGFDRALIVPATPELRQKQQKPVDRMLEGMDQFGASQGDVQDRLSEGPIGTLNSLVPDPDLSQIVLAVPGRGAFKGVQAIAKALRSPKTRTAVKRAIKKRPDAMRLLGIKEIIDWF